MLFFKKNKHRIGDQFQKQSDFMRCYFNKQTLAMHPRRVIPELEIGYQYRADVWGFYASVIRRGSEIKELSNAKAAQNFAKIQFIYALQ